MTCLPTTLDSGAGYGMRGTERQLLVVVSVNSIVVVLVRRVMVWLTGGERAIATA